LNREIPSFHAYYVATRSSIDDGCPSLHTYKPIPRSLKIKNVAGIIYDIVIQNLE